ncbi:MAG TPA: DUF4129 domain-containing protein [Anaerolineales bacterium]|nr:DUF4129 domain-containing protein [Anaerolineales bacterium]
MNTSADGMFPTLKAQRLPLWQVFTVLALMLLDLSWIAAAYTLLAGRLLDLHTGRVFLVFGAIYLVTYLAASALHFLELDEGIVQVLLLTIPISGLVWAAGNLVYFEDPSNIARIIHRYLSSFRSLSVLFKPEFLLTVAVISLWRRGLSIARHPVGPRFIRRAFNSGLLALVATGIVVASLGRSFPSLEAALFFFSSLIAMGGARLSSLSRLHGGREIPFEREWVVGLNLLAGGILVIAGGLGLLAGGPLAVWIGDLLSHIGRFLSRIVLLILWPLLYLFERALAWFIGFIEPFFQGLQAEPIELITVTGMQEAIESLEDLQTVVWAPQVRAILSTVLAVGSVIFLIWIIHYTVRNYRIRHRIKGPQEVERIWPSGSGLDYLRALLQGKAKRAIEGISRLNPAARFIAAARIRRIYASLLRMSARLGEPRSPAETPLEFMENLERIFPASRAELTTITHAYLRVRYGELPETRGQIDEVEYAWKFVRKRGQPNEWAG